MAAPRIALPTLLCALVGCFRPVPFAPATGGWRWSRDRELPSDATTMLGDPAPAALPSDPDVLSLDLEQAIALALRADPALLRRADRLAVADALIDRSAQLENPNLLVRNASLNRLAQGEARLELALRVPVPQPWARDARRQRATLERDATRAAQRGRQQRVRARVRQLFARLAMLEQSGAALERTAARAPRAVEPERSATAGPPRLDLDRALLLLRQAELSDLGHALRLRREAALHELRRLLGLAPERPVVFRLEPPAATPGAAAKPAPGSALLAAAEPALVQRALAQRWELQQAAAKVARADVGAYLERLKRWPWLRYLELSYVARPEFDPDGFQFALSIGVPALSWNRGAIAERDAQRALQGRRAQLLALSIAQEVHTALFRARVCAQRVQDLQRFLLPALAATSAVDDAAAERLVTPRRAINAQWRRLRAQQRYFEAVFEQQSAVIDLELALGETPAAPRLSPRVAGGRVRAVRHRQPGEEQHE